MRQRRLFFFFMSLGVCLWGFVPNVTPTTPKQETVVAAPRGYDTGEFEICTSNCGFENGNVGGWSYRDGYVYVNQDNVRTGRYAVYGTTAERATLYRRLYLSRYTSYTDAGSGTVQVNSYVHPGGSESVQLRVEFFSGAGSFLSSWESGWMGKTSDWESLGNTLAIPPGSRSMYVFFTMKRTSGDFTDVDIDDVSVKVRYRQVDTPTPTETPTTTLTPSRTLSPTRTPTSSKTPTITRSPTLTLTPSVTLVPGTITTSITGRIADAVTALPISGASVCTSIPVSCTTSRTNGTYTIAASAPNIQTITVTKRGYIAITESFALTGAATHKIPFNLSKPLSGSGMRIVVSWETLPADLDSYLFVPMSATSWKQISFGTGNTGSCTREPYACYEREANRGNGPETTSITLLKTGAYSFQVGQYSATGSIERTSKARVHVYSGSSLIRIFTPVQTATPCIGSNCVWSVFSIDGATGTITEENRYYIP